MLVEKGADVNAEDKYGDTPLFYGSQSRIFIVYFKNQ